MSNRMARTGRAASPRTEAATFQIALGDARNGRSAGIPYSLMPALSGGRFATASSSLRKSDAPSAARTRNAPSLAKLMASGLESSMLAVIPVARWMGGGKLLIQRTAIECTPYGGEML